MKKWQIILGIVAVIVVVAIFFFARSSTIYTTQAVVIEKGKAIGMAPYPDRVDFGDIPQGINLAKTVSLTNTGDSDKNIKIYILGSISQLIDVTPGKSFKLEAGKTQEINFKLSMPASAPVGKKFTGRIIIFKLP